MIEKIYELMSRVGITSGQDKILHLLAGFLIAFIVGIFTSVLIGNASGFLAGILKECYDEYKYRKGNKAEGANYFDFFATLVGVFFGGLLVVLV